MRNQNNKRYIHFQFEEDRIIVPGCWGGDFITLPEPPILLDRLPHGFDPNTYYNSPQSETAIHTPTDDNSHQSEAAIHTPTEPYVIKNPQWVNAFRNEWMNHPENFCPPAPTLEEEISDEDNTSPIAAPVTSPVDRWTIKNYYYEVSETVPSERLEKALSLFMDITKIGETIDRRNREVEEFMMSFSLKLHAGDNPLLRLFDKIMDFCRRFEYATNAFFQPEFRYANETRDRDFSSNSAFNRFGF